jgi:hypothetical protein
MSRIIYSMPIECVFLRNARALQVKHAAVTEGELRRRCSLYLEPERAAVTCADVTGLP